MRLVGIVLPLQHQPEHQSGEEAGVGIDLAFDGREPERVRERIGQRARHGSGFDGDELSPRLHPAVLAYQFAGQMRDAPEEEHDAQGAEQRTHDVHHQRHLGRVVGQLGEQVAGEHEEGCSWRVTHLQLIGGGDKFRTVPERGCGLNGAAIDEGSDGKCEPTEQVVHKAKMFHCELMFGFV